MRIGHHSTAGDKKRAINDDFVIFYCAPKNVNIVNGSFFNALLFENKKSICTNTIVELRGW